MSVIPMILFLISVDAAGLLVLDDAPAAAQSMEPEGDIVDVPPEIRHAHVPNLNADDGFVFVNGLYLDAPYRITFSDTDVSINGTIVSLDEFEVWRNEKRLKKGLAKSHAQQVRRQLRLLLEGGGCLVLFEGDPLTTFHSSDSYDLLSVLVNTEDREAFLKEERSWLPNNSWHEWIAGFECPDSLAERANELLTRIDQMQSDFDSRFSARQTLEAVAYPLTIGGMLLTVVAFGHLLLHRPGLPEELENASRAKSRATQALLLIALLSSLDLLWTLLVSRTGDMKELNPLGATLIDDPMALISMKLGATVLAISVLYCLRNHRIARQGAWWGCLICTLVTVRWLTFQSMFV